MLSGGLNKRMYKAWTQSKHSVDISFWVWCCRWEHSSKNKGWPGVPGQFPWEPINGPRAPGRQAQGEVGAPAVPLDTGSECKPSTPPAHMCSVAPMLKCDKDLVSSENLLNAWQHDEDVQGVSPNRTVCFHFGRLAVLDGVSLSCPRPLLSFVLCTSSPFGFYPARGRLRPVACWALRDAWAWTSYPWHTLQLGYGLLPGGARTCQLVWARE